MAKRKKLVHRPSGIVVLESVELPPTKQAYTWTLRMIDLCHTIQAINRSRAQLISVVYLGLDDDSPLMQRKNYSLTYVHTQELQFEEYT